MRIFAGNKTGGASGDSVELWRDPARRISSHISSPGTAPRSHVRSACWKRTYSLRRATQHRGTASPGQAACAEQSWQPRDHARASAPKHLLSSEKHPSPFPLLSTTTQITATAQSLSFPKRHCLGPGQLVLSCSYKCGNLFPGGKTSKDPTQLSCPLCSAVRGAEGRAAETLVPPGPARLLEDTRPPVPWVRAHLQACKTPLPHLHPSGDKRAEPISEGNKHRSSAFSKKLGLKSSHKGRETCPRRLKLVRQQRNP